MYETTLLPEFKQGSTVLFIATRGGLRPDDILDTPMDLELDCETAVNHEIEDETQLAIVKPLWLIIVVVVRKGWTSLAVRRS